MTRTIVKAVVAMAVVAMAVGAVAVGAVVVGAVVPGLMGQRRCQLPGLESRAGGVRVRWRGCGCAGGGKKGAPFPPGPSARLQVFLSNKTKNNVSGKKKNNQKQIVTL